MIVLAGTNAVDAILATSPAASNPGNRGDIDLADADDFLSGDLGFDGLLDGVGNEILYGEHGLEGVGGDAWLMGGAGHDVLEGNSGDDLPEQGGGTDGEQGGNWQFVGDDHDFLSGDIGFDALLDSMMGIAGGDVAAMFGPDQVVAAVSGTHDTAGFFAGAALDWEFAFLAGDDTIDLSADNLGGMVDQTAADDAAADDAAAEDAVADAAVADGRAWALDPGECDGGTGDMVHLAQVELVFLTADDVVA